MGLGIFFWVMDAVLDRLIFKEGPFWGLLLFDPPLHDVYTRIIILLGCTLLGIVLSGVIKNVNRRWQQSAKASPGSGPL